MREIVIFVFIHYSPCSFAWIAKTRDVRKEASGLFEQERIQQI